MAIEERPNGKWRVRYYEHRVIVEADGTASKSCKPRNRTFLLKREAQAFDAEVKRLRREGKNWTAEQDAPTVVLLTIARAYVKAAVDAGAPKNTQRFRSTMIGSLLKFAGKSTPATSLSVSLLDQYAASLPFEGRKAATRHRKVLEAERMWEWAHRRKRQFPGVPQPERITGRDADSIRPPPPVVAVDVASWADVDAMIAKLDQREWHRRVALVMRYQGIRVGQVLQLDWRDVDLDRGILRLRPFKAARSTRAVPLHKELAAAMQSWGRREGRVFLRGNGSPYRPDATGEPFSRAWRLAGVLEARWSKPTGRAGLPGERGKARPTNAIRAAFMSGLLRAGISDSLIHYLQHRAAGKVWEAYIPQEAPESTPWWAQAVEASASVPPLGRG